MSGYTDQSFNPVSTPQLHFYMDYNLGRKQTLIFDADGSLGLGRSNRDRSFGFASEGGYMKEWDASRFTAGVRYNLARNREEYNTGEKSVFHQRKDVETIFSEYMHRIGKITLRGGVSGEFWHSEYVENGKSTNDFMFTPDFTFNWDLGSGSNLTLNYSSYSTTPSLTETSVVTQHHLWSQAFIRMEHSAFCRQPQRTMEPLSWCYNGIQRLYTRGHDFQYLGQFYGLYPVFHRLLAKNHGGTGSADNKRHGFIPPLP